MGRRKTRNKRSPAAKGPAEIGYQREAGLVVADVHSALRDACVPGVTLNQLDQIAYEATVARGADPNFLGYQGFPASVCISVNDVIVHGIPSDRELSEGDMVSFDCGASVQREGRPWHADAAFTCTAGELPKNAAGKRAAELDSVTEQSMWAGIAALAGARLIGEVGAAIEDYVEAAGNELGWTPGIIEGYTGHGIGNRLHEEPTVYNYRVRGRTPKVTAGLVICIEPMLVAGEIDTVVADDEWAVLTADGSLAAHWEHTVAVLDEGISVLTAPDSGLAGLAPFGVVPIDL